MDELDREAREWEEQYWSDHHLAEQEAEKWWDQRREKGRAGSLPLLEDQEMDYPGGDTL